MLSLNGIEASNGKNVVDAHHQCAKDFRTYAESGDLNPAEFKTHDGHGRDSGTIVYGQMIASLRDEESMIIEILKTANGPNVLGDGGNNPNSMPSQGMSNATENMANVVVNDNTANCIIYTYNTGKARQTKYIPNNGSLKLYRNGSTYTPRYSLNSGGGRSTDCSGLASWICMESGLFKPDLIFTSELSKDPSPLISHIMDGYHIEEIDIAYRQKGDILCSSGGSGLSKGKVPTKRTDGSYSTGHCAICYDASHVVGIGGSGRGTTMHGFSPKTYKVCYRVVQGNLPNGEKYISKTGR